MEQPIEEKKKSISFSQIKDWTECAFRHKLNYIDRVSVFKRNIYTAFGNAVHSVCENKLVNPEIEEESLFRSTFEEELRLLLEENVVPDEEEVQSFLGQGLEIVVEVKSSLDKYMEQFAESYEVLQTEEKIFVSLGMKPFEVDDYNFNGYIDLVLKDSNGKIHLIDWKTATWGWDARKKADAVLGYQLVLYKYFYSIQHNVPLKDINVHFGLLKRTATKNKVELFKITSGDKKVQNAIDLLKKVIINVKKKMFLKNRMSCKYCQFYKTDHCK